MAHIQLLYIPYLTEEGQPRNVLSAIVTDATAEDAEALSVLPEWLKDPEKVVMMIEGDSHDVSWL